MQKSLLLICCMLFGTTLQASLSGAEWHVTPNGTLATVNVEEQTVGTLWEIRDAIRQARQARTAPEQDTVWVHPGTYSLESTFELTHEDSGSEGYPITWKSRDPHQAVLVGPELSVLVSAYDLEFVRIEGFKLSQAIDQAIEVAHCQNVSIVNCQIDSIAHTGLHLFGGRDCEIRDCLITDCGEMGIRVEAGDSDADVAADHSISHCQLSRCGNRDSLFASAIMVAGKQHLVSANSITECAGPGIRIYGESHQIVENHLERVCLATSNSAAVLYVQGTDHGGSSIERNTICRVSATPRLDTIAIFLSGGVSNSSVRRNVIEAAGRGIAIDGGMNNVAEENLIHECLIGIQLDGAEGDLSGSSAERRNRIQHNLLQRSGRVAVDSVDTFHANHIVSNLHGDQLFVLDRAEESTRPVITALAAAEHPYLEAGSPVHQAELYD